MHKKSQKNDSVVLHPSNRFSFCFSESSGIGAWGFGKGGGGVRVSREVGVD